MEKSYAKSQVNFIGKTLLTMSFGLLITFAIAMLTPMFLGKISGTIMIGAIIAELAVVFYLSRKIHKMSLAAARMWFFVYAALNGFTLSIVFMTYSLSAVSTVFLITSAMFFCSAMVGMTTKKDLSMMGQFFLMMVIGLILLSVVQIFLPLQGLNFAISILGIVVFCGLTAYDMQKVKKLHAQAYSIDQQAVSKFAVIAALELYLDFINLFLYVLRLFNDD